LIAVPHPPAPFPKGLQGRTPSSPDPFSLKGEGENNEKMDVFGGAAAKHIHFFGFYPRKGDKLDCLSAPESQGKGEK
jgi:hypothetical protein